MLDAGITPRPYHVVLVSDHGQSQGATFRQRYGRSLEDLVREHMGGDPTVTAATGEVEAWGPVNLLLGQLSGQDSVSGRLTKRAIADREPDAPIGASGVVEDTTGPGDAPADLTVVGSGNLGGVWFSNHPDRLTATDIERLHPGLLAVLATHPGVGFIVVQTAAGPMALGAKGTHDLSTGEVVGADPLALFGPDAASDFRHVSAFTYTKLVFDLNPRQYRVEDVLADLRAAGLSTVLLHPFFVPQTVSLPGPLLAAAKALERSGPLAQLALRARFTYLVAASR